MPRHAPLPTMGARPSEPATARHRRRNVSGSTTSDATSTGHDVTPPAPTCPTLVPPPRPQVRPGAGPTDPAARHHDQWSRTRGWPVSMGWRQAPATAGPTSNAAAALGSCAAADAPSPSPRRRTARADSRRGSGPAHVTAHTRRIRQTRFDSSQPQDSSRGRLEHEPTADEHSRTPRGEGACGFKTAQSPQALGAATHAAGTLKQLEVENG